MKLDPSALRYLTDDDFRVLTAVELGMRNHELVPIPLISSISGLRHGGYMRALKQIHKAKLVHKDSARYVGYRLTSLGYDYLALRALVKRGVLSAVGRALGVGKEADVFIVAAAEELFDAHPDLADEPQLAMKLHRLGRTSFRTVKSKRDYLGHRRAASWIYLSRLAAAKEYAFMCALHRRDFPVPRPLGQSRHVVIMQLVPGSLLASVHELPDARETALELLAVAKRLALHGLVHCDLNEFNIMVDDEGTVTVIDFPQMVSTSHPDAAELFERDVAAICRFFNHRFGVPLEDMPHPQLDEVIAERHDTERLDMMVSASGFRNVEDSDGMYGTQDVGETADDSQTHARVDPVSLQIVDTPTGESGSASTAPSKHTQDELAKSDAANDDSNHAQAGNVALSNDVCENEDDDRNENESTDAPKRRDDSERQAQNELGDLSDEKPNATAQSVETGQPVNATEECHDDGPGASLDRAAIEARVRAQRGNRSQRQMYLKRNMVKDSEKRKVKVEMKSEFWQ